MELEALQSAIDFRDASGRTKLPQHILQGLLGSLSCAARPSQDQVLRWMVQNLRKLDLQMLRSHYGYLIQLLRNGQAPRSRLVDLIIACTDESVITQPRVDLLVSLYKSDPLPALSRLLQFIRARCPAHIYIPLQGQKTEYDGHLPLRALAQIEYKNIDKLAAVNLGVWRSLNLKQQVADGVRARTLAELWTFTMQSQQLFLAFENYVYENISSFGPISLGVLARFFRFWPKDVLPGIVEKRLLEPIAQSIHDDLAVIPKVLPELWHFGSRAEVLVSYIAICVATVDPEDEFWSFESRGVEVFHHVLQYFLVTGTVPSSRVATILAQQIGMLPLCAQWADKLPELALTLQGEFSLPAQSSEHVLSVFKAIVGDPDSLFCIANSPWLGSAPGRTFRRLLAEHKQTSTDLNPELKSFSPETLEPLGLPYDEFCLNVVDDLRSANLDISAFFVWDDDGDAVDE